MTGGRLKRALPTSRGRRTFASPMATVLPTSTSTNCCVPSQPQHAGYADRHAVRREIRRAGNRDNAEVTSFSEKPKGDGRWVSGGFFVLSPKVAPYIQGDATIWERDPLETLSRERQVSAYNITASGNRWTRCTTKISSKIFGPPVQPRGKYGELLLARPQSFSDRAHRLQRRWLSLWLEQLGAEVMGYALAPHTSPSLFAVADVAREMTSVIGDLRDLDHMQDAMLQHRPEIVFHLAAQSLVRARIRIRSALTRPMSSAPRACWKLFVPAAPCAPLSSSPPTNATKIRSGSGLTARTIRSAATIPTATARPVRNLSPAPIEILFLRPKNTRSTKSPLLPLEPAM